MLSKFFGGKLAKSRSLSCLCCWQVTRQVAQCKCAKRFQVEQIGENKYRVRQRGPNSALAAQTLFPLRTQGGVPTGGCPSGCGGPPRGDTEPCLPSVSQGVP